MSSSDETRAALISTAGLGRTFGIVAALRDVTLSIDRGELVCVVGASGSGKTTLLNQLGLLDTPTTGSYELDGIDTAGLSDGDRTRLRADVIGFVFQDFHLLSHRTALENVMLGGLYGRDDGTLVEAAARRVLDRVGLSHRVDALPATLSGGERQRVAIARALVGRPQLLLCDEPTGNLDSQSSADVLELLESLNHDGVTVVVITHDETVAQRGRRRIVVRDGRILSDTRQRPERLGTGTPPRAADASTTARNLRDAPRHRTTLRALAGEALATLGQRMSRTLLTMLGTVLGIGALVAVLGLNATASGQVASDFSVLRATEVVVQDAGSEAAADRVYSFPLDADEIAGSLNGVEAAGVSWPLPAWSDPVVTTSLDPRAVQARAPVVAASAGYLRAIEARTSSGVLYDAFHEQHAARVAVIGSGVARQLSITTVAQAPTVFFEGEAFTVVGIIDDVARDPGTLSSVLIPASTALELFGEPLLDRRASMRIATAVGAADLVASQVATALRPDDPSALRAVPPDQPFAVEKRVSQSLQRLFLLLAGVVLVIAAVMIANTTLVAIVERTREIGLRRAVGAQRRDIAVQVLLEASIVGLLGGLLGSATGVLIVVGTSLAASWTALLDPVVTFGAPVVGALVGVLAGAYPAYRATRITPVQALQHS